MKTEALDTSLHFKNEMNVIKLKNYQAKVEGVYEELKLIVTSTNDVNIQSTLELFINSRKKTVDFEMMDFLIRIVLQDNSVIKSFTDITKLIEKSDSTDIQASPNSFSYQFLLSVFYSAMKYVNVFETASLIVQQSKGDTLDNTIWTNRRKELLEKFKKSVNEASRFVGDQKSLSSFLNLPQKNSPPTVQFRKFLQTYWANEKVTNKEQSCAGDCDNKEFIDINDGYCNGYVGNCEYVSKFGVKYPTESFPGADDVVHRDQPETFYISNDNERIYDGHTLGNDFYGKKSNSYKKKLELGSSLNLFLRSCDYCKCTCDQRYDSYSARKIYNGIIVAPEET